MPFEPARNLELRSDSILGGIYHDDGRFAVVSQFSRTKSYRLSLLVTHFFDLIDICVGPPVSDVYHLSHWTTLASAGVRYLFLVCSPYFEFLASLSDVGDAICYAETVHAAAFGSHLPLSRGHTNLIGVHGEPPR